jgi:signal transduction histidine kinase/ActR/RegA family two-component response regulator
MTLSAGASRNLLLPLAQLQRRSEAARELASALGGTGLLLYVRDPAIDVMLPAPGMPKTQGGGPAWREFLLRCLREARLTAAVDLPAGQTVTAQAVVRDGAALIVLGGSVATELLDAIEQELPMLAALLLTEQALHIEKAEAAEARQAAAQARDLTQALDRSRAAAAELNLQLRHEHERKDEFLAMLAHELRNPLSPLVNSIEIVRRSASGDHEPTRRQLDIMSRQLRQLTRLVDDLLDVSRVSRGLIELRRERVALQEILDDAVEAVRPLLDARSHQLQRVPVAGHVVVNADRVRLTQVFANLLTNAAKYTDPGGRISISVVVDGHRVSVVVQDTGIGIAPQMQARVFDMFTQAPGTLARSHGGLGIGLTLVRRLVELHGGRVTAYSRGLGHGSTFTVSLPQVTLPAPAPAPAPAQPPAPAEPAVPGRATAASRVLVVDDNGDAADTLGALMQVMGAEVRVAHAGSEALAVAQLFSPDLILLDIGLPGMDGYETARRLRQLPDLHARLVALTGYGSAQDREKALAAGFDDHLVKPLSAEGTQALLAQAAAMHGAS